MGKNAGVDARKIALAKRSRAAGLVDGAMLARVQEAYRSAGTVEYEMRAE